ncbi:MAG TPA: hypothetical protein VJ346_07625 [Bacteroidales bacterium]|nr:hypothetical protein [Bacteroidales bacterium]
MNHKDKPDRRIFVKQTGLAGITALSVTVWLSKTVSMMDLKDKRSKKELRILFQGDSITDGNRSRNNDWNHLMVSIPCLQDMS